MIKLHLIISILFVVFIISCAEEKCYTCEKSGILPQKVSNVCGTTMLEYHQKQGFRCYESGSASKVNNITGPSDESMSEATFIAFPDTIDWNCEEVEKE